MFDGEVVSGVKAHFQEVLDQLRRQDAYKDEAPEEDDDEEELQ